MRIIAITLPYAIDSEATIIRRLLANGIDIIHLRKPEADIDYCRHLLSQLAEDERAKIVIHDYPTLYDEFALRGIHLNRYITHLPDE